MVDKPLEVILGGVGIEEAEWRRQTGEIVPDENCRKMANLLAFCQIIRQFPLTWRDRLNRTRCKIGRFGQRRPHLARWRDR